MKTSSLPSRARHLIDAYCTDRLDADELRELESILEGDGRARRFFAAYCRMHAGLLFAARAEQALIAARDLAEPRPAPAPAFVPLSGVWQGAVSYFSQVGPLSYLLAVAITGAMLLAGWAYKITHDYGPSHANNSSFAKNSRGLTAPGFPAIKHPDPVFVARVTGMNDCRWADPTTETYAGAFVPLGRKYALASGLMEITYSSGAKVILEGPCRYEVESTAGGFLALGKLTARVDARGQRSEIRGQRSEHYPLPTTHYPLFSVRTPTAVVTDLGTEFGVAVAANGDTTSHVFQGRVVVHSLAAASTRREPSSDSPKSQIPNPKSQIFLASGESARVEKRNGDDKPRLELVKMEGYAASFKRQLIEKLDLLDIVAGGNGLGNRRERGIDPATGIMAPKYIDVRCPGENRYSSVVWNRMIDGVFIPDCRAGAVQLDSAGHKFDGFPETMGRSWGSIWPRAAKVEASQDDKSWIYRINDAERFMPEGRGLLAFCPNVGLTFDLGMVRKTYLESRPARFNATAGLGKSSLAPDADGLVDLWIFVDGRLKFKRIGLGRKDGRLKLDLELGPDDRFVTLVSTDGGDGIFADWLVLGDPALILSENRKED